MIQVDNERLVYNTHHAKHLTWITSQPSHPHRNTLRKVFILFPFVH